MQSDNPSVAGTPAVTLEADAPLRIECYVRPTVPPAITDTINDVLDRVRRLEDRDSVADYRIQHWPTESTGVEIADDAGTESRENLVDEFECWADRHGHSIAPAFQRREIPPSPFDVGPEEPRERLRVPLVALAVYALEGEATTLEGDADPKLEGVVPYTDGSTAQTYTVDEWLSFVEPNGFDGFSRSSGQPRRLESHQ